MSRRAYIYFILTFLLGLVVGAAGTVFFAWHTGMMRPRHPDEQRIVKFLHSYLKLNDQQTQQVGDIVRDTDEKFRQLQTQVGPQFDAIREASRDRIRKLLTPDQLAKFNALVQRMDEHRKAHRQH